MDSVLFNIILITVLIVVVLVALLIYYRHNNPKVPKTAGRTAGTAEKAVARAKSFARQNDYRVIAPARLSGRGSFADLDAIVIGYFGILGVKAYGYNGEIYGTTQDAQWLQVAASGERVNFPNPIDEASADVRVIRDALFAAKLKQIPVEVVCVFTDPKAQLALPRGTGHYTMKTFKDLLGKEKYTEDKGLDLDKVEAALKAAMVQS